MEKFFEAQTWESVQLEDIYMMSCKSSQEIPDNKKNILKPTKTLILAIAISLAADSYASSKCSENLYIDNISVEHLHKFDETNIVHSSGDLEMLVNVSPFVLDFTISKIKGVKEDNSKNNALVQKLLNSYSKNSSDHKLPNEILAVMKDANVLLSDLNFYDAILQYDSFDEAWHYNLFFDKNIELSLYIDEIDNADFSIYHNGKLIVSNTIPLTSLITKMKSITSIVQEND